MKKIAILAFCLISLQAAAQYDTIKVSTPNSGLGDNLRTAGHKMNALIEDMNTIQIYNISQPEMAILNGALVTTTELNYLVGTSGAIQTQINAKAPTASPTFTGTVVLPSTTSIATVSSTEIGYIDGLTGSAASRQDINDTADVYLAAAQQGVLLTNRNYLLEDLQDAGMDIVAMPIGATLLLTSYTNMTDGRAYYVLFNQKAAATFTGVGWIQRVQGIYTADNYNGVALYSVSGTTYTKVASTTDDGNIWKGGSYTKQTKAFSSPYSAAAGLYMIAFVYNTSAETTAPSVYDWNLVSGVSQLMTGGHKLAGYVATQNTLPDEETAGDITANGQCGGMWIY